MRRATPIRPPAVSVVVPARNEERMIGRALRSLLRQTLSDIEILVVDDRSTDETAAIVQSMAWTDSRIRYLPNEGKGFVDAQNSGLAACRAPLVARLDADDASRPRRLECQVRELDATPSAVAIGTYGWRVNEWGLPVARLRTGPAGREGYRALVREGECVRLTHSSVMFRRAAVERVGGYKADYHPADDFKLWNDLLDHGEVYALPLNLTLYTLRAGSMSEAAGMEMALQVARVRREPGRGADSRPELVRPFALSARQLESAKRQLTRRRLSRALANGRIGEAARILRQETVARTELLGLLEQAKRG